MTQIDLLKFNYHGVSVCEQAMWRKQHELSACVFLDRRMCLKIVGFTFTINGVILKITYVKTCFPIQMFHNRIDGLSIWKELQTLDEPELKTQMLVNLSKRMDVND